MKQKLTSDEIKKLRDKLPKNYAKTLAELTGQSRSTIYSVMAGVRNNEQVVEAAIELAQSNQEKHKTNKKRIKEIIES